MKKIRPKRIVEGIGKTLLNKNTESSIKRLSICKPCPHNKKGICGLCGCIEEAKSKVFEEYCPDNRWHDIKALKMQGIAVAVKNPELLQSFEVNESGKGFTVDYGEVKPGDSMKLDFIVVNDRSNSFDEEITLTGIKMKSSCGCTHVATDMSKELKDGDYAPFSIDYNNDILGQIRQSVRFISDQLVFRISIKGNVKG